ncbi:uncharacterized protein LTR77_008709 [Saxophila tyrrhenica]|uniref:Uncharacterized protein n=1 Tax=Saxophila tyrrhenica TaxID=1690608 RepID=A0AAV9P0H5_9PEZI|nr:hypothetical protein LTR77_008709 [Saxophila tyrrhenica]
MAEDTASQLETKDEKSSSQRSREQYLENAGNAQSTYLQSKNALYLSPAQEAAVWSYMERFEKGHGVRNHPQIRTLMAWDRDSVDVQRLVMALHGDFNFPYDPFDNNQYTMQTKINDVVVNGEVDRDWAPRLGSCPRHVEVCILVYHVNDRDSFEAIQRYYDTFCLQRSEAPPSRLYCRYRRHEDGCAGTPVWSTLVFVVAWIEQSTHRHDESFWKVPRTEGEEFCAKIGGVFVVMCPGLREGCGPETLVAMAYRTLYRRIENEYLQGGPVDLDDGSEMPGACDVAEQQPRFRTKQFRSLLGRIRSVKSKAKA